MKTIKKLISLYKTYKKNKYRKMKLGDLYKMKGATEQELSKEAVRRADLAYNKAIGTK